MAALVGDHLAMGVKEALSRRDAMMDAARRVRGRWRLRHCWLQALSHAAGHLAISTRAVSGVYLSPPNTPKGHGGQRVLKIGHGRSCERPGTPVTMLREAAHVKFGAGAAC